MIQSVCIYCASSADIDTPYVKDAERLGALLGQRSMHVINGGGSIGLMRAVSDATLKAGGTVTGIIPRFMVESGWCHDGLTALIRTETMHERKQMMAGLSDAAIALPGGYGTLEELLEIITWRQLGLYKKPVIILNTNSYYDPLLEMFSRATRENFIRAGHASLWQVAKTPEEVIAIFNR
ncbi:MAG: TIGR00730 family Rossman fold protein [Tannerella sp.]|nr:TIGR00730 family Rossman fold protein [Tannerella sp.]